MKIDKAIVHRIGCINAIKMCSRGPVGETFTLSGGLTGIMVTPAQMGFNFQLNTKGTQLSSILSLVEYMSSTTRNLRMSDYIFWFSNTQTLLLYSTVNTAPPPTPAKKN